MTIRAPKTFKRGILFHLIIQKYKSGHAAYKVQRPNITFRVIPPKNQRRMLLKQRKRGQQVPRQPLCGITTFGPKCNGERQRSLASPATEVQPCHYHVLHNEDNVTGQSSPLSFPFLTQLSASGEQPPIEASTFCRTT